MQNMEDILVPIVFFGSICLIVYLVSLFNARKRNTVHETLRHLVDKGESLTPEMIERMSLIADPVRKDLRRGVLFIAFGAAFAFLGMMVGTEDAEAVKPMLGVASFPVIIGLAYLGLWLGQRNAKAA